MRKSNSKEARRAVEAYVMDEVNDIIERTGEPEPARPVTAAFNTLKEEMSFQSYHSNDRDIIGSGLAKKYREAGRWSGYTAATGPYLVWYLAVFNGEFEAYTGSVYDRLRFWLDETEEEAERYNSDQAWKLYAHMSASAFERLHERENTPHRISTAEFIRLYQQQNGGHFFDPDTLRYWGQTRRSFTVYAFELVTDSTGTERDCYAVYHTITSPTGERFPKVHYFERDTLAEVFTGSDNA